MVPVCYLQLLYPERWMSILNSDTDGDWMNLFYGNRTLVPHQRLCYQFLISFRFTFVANRFYVVYSFVLVFVHILQIKVFLISIFCSSLYYCIFHLTMKNEDMMENSIGPHSSVSKQFSIAALYNCKQKQKQYKHFYYFLTELAFKNVVIHNLLNTLPWKVFHIQI